MDTNFDELYNKANEAFREGQIVEAEKLLYQVAEQKPFYADVHHKLGVINHQKGNLKKAVEHFQKALEINPNYTEARLNLTITYNAIGQYDSALEVFGGAVQQAILESGGLDPYLKAMLANEHFKLGNIYYDLGEVQEAIDQYKKAVTLCPHFPDVRTKLGIALRDLGHFDEAVTELKAVLKIKSSYLSARNNLGLTYLKMGDKNKAKIEWDRVLAVNPKDSIASACMHMLAAQENKSE